MCTCAFLVAAFTLVGSSARAGEAGAGASFRLGAHWGSPGRPARAASSFQSIASALGLGVSKSLLMLFNSRVSVSHSPLVTSIAFQAS